MAQILGAIATILIVAIIAAAIIAICGGIKDIDEQPEPYTDPKSSNPRQYQNNGSRNASYSAPEPADDSDNETVTDDDCPPHAWSLELLDPDGKVKERYAIPQDIDGGVTLGRSSGSMIHISGYGDMSRRHIIIRRDSRGVYFMASIKCSSKIYVNGKLIYNGKIQPRQPEKTKTYLREGMKLKLGSAVFRVRSN